jgi:hypothetical protein
MLDLSVVFRVFGVRRARCPRCGGERVNPSERPAGPLGRLFGYRFYRCLACSTLFPAVGEMPSKVGSPPESRAEPREEELAGALDRELRKISIYVDPWDDAPSSPPADSFGPAPRKASSA